MTLVDMANSPRRNVSSLGISRIDKTLSRQFLVLAFQPPTIAAVSHRFTAMAKTDLYASQFSLLFHSACVLLPCKQHAGELQPEKNILAALKKCLAKLIENASRRAVTVSMNQTYAGERLQMDPVCFKVHKTAHRSHCSKRGFV